MRRETCFGIDWAAQAKEGVPVEAWCYDCGWGYKGSDAAERRQEHINEHPKHMTGVISLVR